MLEVKVIDILGRTRFEVRCPKCKDTISFFVACPMYCAECGAEVPNAVGMVRYNDERKMYHKKGKTVRGMRTI